MQSSGIQRSAFWYGTPHQLTERCDRLWLLNALAVALLTMLGASRRGCRTVRDAAGNELLNMKRMMNGFNFGAAVTYPQVKFKKLADVSVT
jgi:hypothetical protein